MSLDDRPATAPDGFVIVDKPAGWTSHDVVGRIRRLAATRRVGHAGTLDPMATGVLVVGVGRATRLLTYVVGAGKEYTATIRLGIGTKSDDADGEVTSTPGYAGSVQDVAQAVASLTGDIMQVPAKVSAIKVDGQRAHARVRSGEEVKLAARPVTVTRFDVLDSRTSTVENDDAAVTPVLDLDVAVEVSSGTYVRALARDLGAALGTAGHLTALKRTRVGGHTLDAASNLDALAAQVEGDGCLTTIPLHEAAAAHLPIRRLSLDETRELGFGRWIEPTGEPDAHAALAPDGSLIAVLEDTRRRGETQARPVLVFTTPG